MGEPRRIELMPAAPVENKGKKGKLSSTIRFNLALTETTERTCPEFSYVQLLKNAVVSREKVFKIIILVGFVEKNQLSRILVKFFNFFLGPFWDFPNPRDCIETH